MDIAHIVWSFRTGGIENMLVNIMACQADDRHDVSLFVVYEHLGDYHLMAHPARCEGFGLAVAEAMAGGVPVLVPDSGPLCAPVDNGRYGATFHSGDHRDLARIISAMMRHHADAVAKTPTARQHIIDRYSLRHQVSAYARLYQRCFFE